MIYTNTQIQTIFNDNGMEFWTFLDKDCLKVQGQTVNIGIYYLKNNARKNYDAVGRRSEKTAVRTTSEKNDLRSRNESEMKMTENRDWEVKVKWKSFEIKKSKL